MLNRGTRNRVGGSNPPPSAKGEGLMGFANKFPIRQVEKQWGWYQVMEEGVRDGIEYWSKYLIYRQDQAMSLQSHDFRTEWWEVVEGRGIAQIGDTEYEISKGWKGIVPVKTKHRITNNSDLYLTVKEDVKGVYCWEEDLIRYEDMYGKLDKCVVVSGGFDPLHIGHIQLFKVARQLGTYLIVLLNSDDWLTRKKGKPFMDYVGRWAVVRTNKWVDEVLPALDRDGTVVDSIRKLVLERKIHIFANGGDRKKENTPEDRACELLGVETVYGLGEKVESSSRLVGR